MKHFSRPIRTIVQALSVTAILCVCSAAQAQIFKCVVDGKLAFQQAPCTSGTGAEIKVKPSMPGRTARNPAPIAAEFAAPAPTPVAAPVAAAPVAPPAGPAKTELERQSDTCLDWYRPRLRDPKGAYYRDASFERGVLTITIYATNANGGYVSNTANCEFKNGELDHDWTKIHAERRRW